MVNYKGNKASVVGLREDGAVKLYLVVVVTREAERGTIRVYTLDGAYEDGPPMLSGVEAVNWIRLHYHDAVDLKEAYDTISAADRGRITDLHQGIRTMDLAEYMDGMTGKVVAVGDKFTIEFSRGWDRVHVTVPLVDSAEQAEKMLREALASVQTQGPDVAQEGQEGR